MSELSKKIICALDTPSLESALAQIRPLAGKVAGFKIGHALTLEHGLEVIKPLQDAGAEKIFLDLKLHDIPNSVALAVETLSRYGVWMTTLHISGGSEMMKASAKAISKLVAGERPLLMGVSVLTSLNQEALTNELAVTRNVEDHMVALSHLAMDSGLDGLICSPLEIALLRKELGAKPVLVSPGIRAAQGSTHDQQRTGTLVEAVASGVDYVVVGRALSEAQDVDAALSHLTTA